MNIGHRIKLAIEERGMEPNRVAVAIQMSTANLYRIFKRDSVETKYLVRLCELLELPMSYFFDEDHEHFLTFKTPVKARPSASYFAQESEPAYGMGNNLAEEVKELRQKLAFAEQRIADKDQMIQVLMASLNYQAAKASSAGAEGSGDLS